MPIKKAPAYRPYKILTYMWYGKYPWLTRDKLKVHMRIERGLRKIVVQPNHHIYKYFEWLEQCGFIKNFGYGCDEITCELVPPRWLTEDWDGNVTDRERREFNWQL